MAPLLVLFRKGEGREGWGIGKGRREVGRVRFGGGGRERDRREGEVRRKGEIERKGLRKVAG